MPAPEGPEAPQDGRRAPVRGRADAAVDAAALDQDLNGPTDDDLGELERQEAGELDADGDGPSDPGSQEDKPGSVHGESIPDIEKYKKGVGVGFGSPEIGERGKRRQKERDLDMGPVESRMTEAPLGSDTEDMTEFVKALSRKGSRMRFRVLRLWPDDMPPPEMAESDWINMPPGDPDPDWAKQQIRSRFGGGRFEVLICDHDPAKVSSTATRTHIDIMGDPIPQTNDGQLWFKRKYGPTAMMGSPTIGPDGKPGPFSSSPGFGGENIFQTWLSLNAERDRRDHEEKLKDKDRDGGIAMTLVQAMLAKGGGNNGILAAVIAIVPALLEFLRGMREDSRKDREAAERRFQEVLERSMKPQDSNVFYEQAKAAIAMTQKRGEVEMDIFKNNSQKMFEHTLQMLKDQGRSDEELGILQTLAGVLRENGSDLIKGLMPVIMRMGTGQTAQQAALNSGVDPRILAARGGQPRALPPRPAGPVPVDPRLARQPRPPTPPPGAAPAGPGPIPPPSAAREPGSEDLQLPPAPEGPAPEATPEAPPPAATDTPSAPPARMDPRFFAQQVAMEAMSKWVAYVYGFATSGEYPDASDLWDAVFDGQTMQVLFGLSPIKFRTKIQEIDTKESFILGPCVEGFPEDIVAMVSDLDMHLERNKQSRDWLAEFLDLGPWNDEPDEDDPE